MRKFVLAHGGAASSQRDKDGPERAARRAMQVLADGGTPLGAVVEAVSLLEDDPRFNAGTGSNLRFDGETIEMDAACMDSSGRFGGVACIRDVKNPVRVARELLRTPHTLLAGHGATAFARCLGFGPHNAWTKGARQRYDALVEGMRASDFSPSACGWDVRELRAVWNYDIPLEKLLGPDDTVGAVATDGRAFAAALSTGGTMATLLGRVGDVPLPGCGLHAGDAGAVAVTGHGDVLSRAMLASRVYRDLEDGLAPDAARDAAIARFASEPDVDVGVILLTRDGWSGGSNRDMAWAVVEEESP